MPWGMGQNFWPPRGAQGGAQCTEFGVSEGANYSLEFCTLLVPIPVTSHPILILIVCEMFWRHLHAYHTHIFAPTRVRTCEISHIRTSLVNFCIWARHGLHRSMRARTRAMCGRTCVCGMCVRAALFWACDVRSHFCTLFASKWPEKTYSLS